MSNIPTREEFFRAQAQKSIPSWDPPLAFAVTDTGVAHGPLDNPQGARPARSRAAMTLDARNALPTRAEFIRERLADHLTELGYTPTPQEHEHIDTGATLYTLAAGGLVGDVQVFENGELRDWETGELWWFGGFEWHAEPTDTGVVHGPDPYPIGMKALLLGVGVITTAEADTGVMHGPWLGGARVTTPDGPGTALASEFGALDVVRVQLDSMADYHSGYCYRRCDLKILHSVGQRVRGTTRTV